MSAVKKLPKITDPEILEREHSARESWHAFEIMAEFVDATERLKEITPAVSIFGSARTPSDHAYYKLTEEIARLLSDACFSVISGGDLNFIQIIDEPKDVVEAIFKHYETRGFEPSPLERQIQFYL
jgi:predicted Rossmann-fold nucleotide-binding protein